jgi:hypothetical protein
MQLNRIFRFSRLFAAVVLVASVNPFARTSEPANLHLVVDTLLDSNDLAYQACTSNANDCSLRGAISKANADPNQVYQIMLPAGTYALTIPGTHEDANATGDLDLLTRVSITGEGKDSTVIDAQGIDRVLDVHAGGWVTLTRVKITGGKTADGGLARNGVDGFPSEDGGGIYNGGHLELDECAVIDNHTGHGGDGANGPNHGSYGNGAASGEGGGIYNASSLTLKHTVILSNTTGTGGNGGTNCLDPISCYTGYGGKGANAGDGGGILNAGTLSLADSNLSANATGTGGVGGFWQWANEYSGFKYGGAGGFGGGLANRGSVQAISITIESNTAGRGGEITGSGGQGGGIYNSGWIAIDQGQINRNHSGDGAGGGAYDGDRGGTGGSGGGINNGAYLSLTYSHVEGNSTGNGAYGSKLKGGGMPGGDGGCGGGIYNAGDLNISFSPILSNTTGEGGVSDVNGGQGGAGGGICNAISGSMVSRFSPVSGNQTGQGGAQMYPDEGTPGNGGHGGGVYNEGFLDLKGSLISLNAAGPGSAGSGTTVDAPGGDGGGLYITSGPITLTNEIIAENHLQPGGKGSGMYLAGQANLLNLTLARNSGGDGSGINFTGSELTLKNSILVSQTVGITATQGTTHLENTLWGSGAWANLADWAGTGVFTHTNDFHGDPGFIDPDKGDYHIQPSSPAVDQGVQTSVMVDIDNQPRPNPNTGIPDLGADEVWTLTPIDAVTIHASASITATVPVSFTAVISPTGATPNITYIWYPSPSLGQGSDTAIYSWSDPGTYTITVTAQNAGSFARAAYGVTVAPGPVYRQYLPILEIDTK